MARIFLLVLPLIFCLISPCSAGEQSISLELISRYNPHSVKVDGKGNIWVAYYDLDRSLHLMNLSVGNNLIVNEGKGDYSKGFAFDVQGDHAFVVWREKVAGSKKLYFRASHDGGMTLSEPIILDNNTTEALTRIKIGSNPSGDVFVVWYGERITEDATYHMYAISSNDFGKTFSDITNLTSGYRRSIYPTLLVDDKNAYIFSYSRKGDKIYMIFSKTVDRGKSWSKPVEIKEGIGTVTLFIEPIKVGDRLHVFWFNSYDGNPVLEGAYSDDGGDTWTTTTFESTKDFEVILLRVAGDNKGHIYLALSGVWDYKGKDKSFIIRSDDNGTTWSDLTPIRHYPFDHTKAGFSHIIAGDSGEVIIVWVDYRNIRSNIYMQYSKDYGLTWQEKDIPLEELGRFNTSYYPYTDSFTKFGEKYYLLAYRFPGDLILEAAELLLIDFTINDRGAK
jgi:hypothetical protein